MSYDASSQTLGPVKRFTSNELNQSIGDMADIEIDIIESAIGAE